MQKTVLIISNYAYKDPVFQSAVLPYFMSFPNKEKYLFIMHTFENSTYPVFDYEKGIVEEKLRANNIVWYKTNWNFGNYKLFKKIFDFIKTIVISIRLVVKYKVDVVYSEGWPGAIFGHYIARITNRKHFVHTFEPHADYMVEAGIWSETSWETRILRWQELPVAKYATCIFTATNVMIDNLVQKGVRRDALYRVPSCVDLHHFKFDDGTRQQIRRQLEIEEHQPVLVYLGKFGGMYMEEEAFEFFELCQQKLNAYIFILSTDDPKKLKALSEKYNLSKANLLIKSLTRQEVPAYLSASDMGFVAVRQWPSKKYCSPIKTGEYLACGLPVIVPVGVSDDYTDMEQAGVGVVMPSFEKKSFHLVINEWEKRFTMNNPVVRLQAREYAAKHRNIDVYKDLYAKLFDAL